MAITRTDAECRLSSHEAFGGTAPSVRLVITEASPEASCRTSCAACRWPITHWPASLGPRWCKFSACGVGTGVEPTWTGLQPVAVPSGSSLASFSVLARSRAWSSTFAGSRANPLHSEDVFSFSAPPRNRTSSGSFEDCHARPAHPQGVLFSVSRPGLEPGSGPSEGPMRSLAPSRRSLFPTRSRTRPKALGQPYAIRYTIGTDISEPTTGLAPA